MDENGQYFIAFQNWDPGYNCSVCVSCGDFGTKLLPETRQSFDDRTYYSDWKTVNYLTFRKIQGGRKLVAAKTSQIIMLCKLLLQQPELMLREGGPFFPRFIFPHGYCWLGTGSWRFQLVVTCMMMGQHLLSLSCKEQFMSIGLLDMGNPEIRDWNQTRTASDGIKRATLYLMCHANHGTCTLFWREECWGSHTPARSVLQLLASWNKFRLDRRSRKTETNRRKS